MAEKGMEHFIKLYLKFAEYFKKEIEQNPSEIQNWEKVSTLKGKIISVTLELLLEFPEAAKSLSTDLVVKFLNDANR